jgi:hypothetical protein
MYELGQHTARGATKEKTQRLDELKAKRKAKDDKKRVRHFANPTIVNLITPYSPRPTTLPHDKTVPFHLKIWIYPSPNQKMVRSVNKNKKKNDSSTFLPGLILEAKVEWVRIRKIWMHLV